MITLTQDHEEMRHEIRAKISGMRKVLLDFAEEESPLVNQIARETIFSGDAKSALRVRTGSTQREGLLQKHFNKFSKRNSRVGEAYWSRITNIFDNLKERKKMTLLKSLASEFRTDSKVQRIFEHALDDFKDIK